MRRLALILVALLWALPASAAFSYYKSATLNGSTQAGASDSTNWPLTIGLDGTVQTADADLKVVGSGGFVQSSSGYDIRPYSDSGLTTPLTYQLVFYDGTTGKLEMHVLISTLHHSSNDVIYLAFGDASIVADGSSTSTWNSAYTNVYHVSDGSTLNLTGSTATPANLTNVNTSTAVAGEIDGGVQFALASSQYLTNATAPTSTYPVTLESWVKLTDTTMADLDERVAVCLCNSGSLEEFWYGYWKSNVTHAIAFRAVTQGSGVAKTVLATLTADTSWHHLVAVYPSAASTFILYYDGADLSGTTQGGSVNNTPSGVNAIYVGIVGYNTGSLYGKMNGSQDEVRVSNVSRGADYILATYNAAKPSSTFITWGTKVTVGGASAGARLPLTGVGK